MSVINLPSADATRAFGQQLAGYLQAGDVLLLDGTLGAGKTTLAQAIIGTLSVEKTEVVSPTFNLLQRYPVKYANGAEGQCVHADLYRLESEEELTEIGLEEAYGHALCIIEWPSRLGRRVPSHYIYCGIEADNASQGRQVTIRMQGDAARPELAAWITSLQNG